MGRVRKWILPKEINLPNALTAIRLILTPVVVLFIVNDNLSLALVAFVVAASTDYLDGVIARAWGLQTRLGAVLDPIADKVLVFAMLVMLPSLGSLPAWFSVLVMSRDLLLGLGVLVLHLKRIPFVIDPSRMSKYATTGEFLSISVGIVALGWAPGLTEYLAAAILGTVLLVAVSFVDYASRFVAAIRLRGARAT